MPATFNCPHCGKKYPNSPALIGRKVRCSDCKNAFQLQGDGSVKKIEIQAKKEEIKPQAKPKSGPREAVAAKPATKRLTKELTQRQKKISNSMTKRLQRGSAALGDAAKEAIAHLDQQEAKSSSQIAPGVSKKQIENMQTVRVAEQRRVSPVWYGGLGFFVVVILYVLLGLESSPERAALEYYSSRVNEDQRAYPIRMDTYRQRAWLYTRDGENDVPVILNASSAELSPGKTMRWQELVTICQKHIGGMSLLRPFGIFVTSDKQAMVEQLWDKFPQKHNFSNFYALLRNKNISYVNCKNVPDLLEKDGATPEEIYIISVLLAGTRNKEGQPAMDYGLISGLAADEAELFLFAGEKSMVLNERANDYDISVEESFCGMVLAFKGIPGEADQWKILDLRFGKDMSEYYAPEKNPLRLITTRARERIMQANVLVEEDEGPREVQP